MNVAHDVTIGTGGAAFPGVFAEPEQPKGGVVVLQEAFGLTTHIRSICERLAAAGFAAVAPALFHREGAPVFSYEDFAGAGPVMATLRADNLLADVQAVIGHLEAAGIPAPACGIVGFCMGGSVALYAATHVAIGAAVSFYGGGVVEGRFGMGSLAELAPGLRTPWLGLYGDEDGSIPVAHAEALRAAAARAPVETELVRYPGAGHGFNCDERPSYVPAAASDAWARTLAFFDAHLAR